MRNRLGGITAIALAAASFAAAQQQDTGPLSVIDWLDTQATVPAALFPPSEPDVTTTATVPSVSVSSLDSAASKRVGLAPSNITGLPDTLWSDSKGAVLARAIAAMPDLRQPALQSLFFTLLLAEALPPGDQASAFDLARVDALIRLGALDPAIALLEQSGPTASAGHMQRQIDMALLAGIEGSACATLQAQPQLSPGQAYDVFCTARAGDWNTAALLLGTGRALGLMDPGTVKALERFLDPDLFEGEAPLPVPQTPNALLFRVYQAIGTPVPTRSWPVVYSNADLSETAGWKAQIEAAERLARTGALPDNRLLGLYTQRQPAASGGVWDRVAALQRFETALGTRNIAAVSKTLPGAWRAMQAAQLSSAFSNIFAQELSTVVLSGASADIAFRVVLLSPDYEQAAQVFPSRALQQPVLAAVAAGEVPKDLDATGIGGAVLAAFKDAPADQRIVASAQEGKLGHAILRTLALTHAGAQGDVAQLTTGLATLRALGLEDVARRAALQILLQSDRT